MDAWICITCGTQFPPSADPPDDCPICQDERQYVGHQGQQWTTLARMRAEGFHNEIRELEPSLTELHTSPKFAIGQRALLLETDEGNVLWDCVTLLDDATIAEVRARGGIAAIAISHPHYYTTMVEWAEQFDARIYLHEADREWVMRGSDRITFWSGERYPLLRDATLVRLGGHFPGGTVLHWASGADLLGVMLTGDIINVVADRRWVSFMYSYPNLIPLPAAVVRGIGVAVAPYAFDRIYGAWTDAIVAYEAKEAVDRSVTRYVRALEIGV
jgi:hypothetical protein